MFATAGKTMVGQQIMKLSYILGAIIAVSFLTGCAVTTKPGDYYVYDNPEAWLIADNGCKVNRYYIYEAQSVNWSGDCVDGFAIGKGQLTWVEPDGTEAFWQTCLQPEHPFAYCYMGRGKLF